MALPPTGAVVLLGAIAYFDRINFSGDLQNSIVQKCLRARSSHPKTVQPTFDAAKPEQLRTLLHGSPREFDKARSIEYAKQPGWGFGYEIWWCALPYPVCKLGEMTKHCNLNRAVLIG